jgi:hypothetical protein
VGGRNCEPKGEVVYCCAGSAGLVGFDTQHLNSSDTLLAIERRGRIMQHYPRHTPDGGMAGHGEAS